MSEAHDARAALDRAVARQKLAREAADKVAAEIAAQREREAGANPDAATDARP